MKTVYITFIQEDLEKFLDERVLCLLTECFAFLGFTTEAPLALASDKSEVLTAHEFTPSNYR